LSYGSLWERLVRGVRWSWVNPRYVAALPPDLDASIMTLEALDRLHSKQGRSTARVVFDSGPGDSDQPGNTSPAGPVAVGPLVVYLKRHFRLPWLTRLAALVDPGGRHSPGAAEWSHLERARLLGVPVPEVVAAGERIGPWTSLQSYLVVAELTGSQELNLALPELQNGMDSYSFSVLKRRLIREMAAITATLHRARVFHKDLYLCHFYLDRRRLRDDPTNLRVALIDLHRLGEHRFWPDRWRWKDLGELCYSTEGVKGIERRDLLRFWVHYRRHVGLRWPRWQFRMVKLKAAGYLRHNRSLT
jgi:heptose I phosphotransferase